MTQRAILYARFSSDLQSAASVEDQLRLCRVRAEREGWIVVGEHSDKAISGAVRDRPGLNKLLAGIERGHADIVLVESLDRLSRDLEHVAYIYKRVTFHDALIVTLSEGPVSDMHIGLRGTKASLYLKDLAAKTWRGQEGRVRQGRAIGTAPYGYRMLRRIGQDGELERGLRSIDEMEAAVVQRIFQLYAEGVKPLRIARTLNGEGIPGPSGGPWLADTIRGRGKRREGVLNNPIYAGRLVWNRMRNLKDPVTGTTRRRVNGRNEHVEVPVPDLRIVDEELWQAVQTRLKENAAAPNPAAPGREGGFWTRRQPRHLLTGKVFCGTCGRHFAAVGKDYLRCVDARHGNCPNRVSLRRVHLEHRVLRAMGERLMAPALLNTLIEVLREEINRMTLEASAAKTATSRVKAVLERRIANLVDALADGDRSTSLRSRLAELEQQLELVNQEQTPESLNIPKIPDDPAALYRSRIAEFEAALSEDALPDLRERARACIHRLEIQPPCEEGGPPNIILEGDLPRMIQLANIGTTQKGAANGTALLDQLVECSVKRDPGARPLLGCRGETPGLPAA